MSSHQHAIPVPLSQQPASERTTEATVTETNLLQRLMTVSSQPHAKRTQVLGLQRLVGNQRTRAFLQNHTRTNIIQRQDAADNDADDNENDFGLREDDEIVDYANQALDDADDTRSANGQTMVSFAENTLQNARDRLPAEMPRPDVEVVEDIKGANNYGSFAWQNWKVSVSERDFIELINNEHGGTLGLGSVVAVADVPQPVLAKLTGVIAHEMRHAEQYWLMARRLAAQGKTIAEIEQEMSIPNNVASAAKETPLTEGPQAAAADEWHAGQFGEHKTFVELTNRILILIEKCVKFYNWIQTYNGADWDKQYLDGVDIIVKLLNTKIVPKLNAEQQRLNGLQQPNTEYVAQMKGFVADYETHINTVLNTHTGSRADKLLPANRIKIVNALQDLRQVRIDAYKSFPHEADAYGLQESTEGAFTVMGIGRKAQQAARIEP